MASVWRRTSACAVRALSFEFAQHSTTCVHTVGRATFRHDGHSSGAGRARPASLLHSSGRAPGARRWTHTSSGVPVDLFAHVPRHFLKA
jgi:hypothetical protein